MATVRFSNGLIDRIRSNARTKMAPAIEKAKESKPDNSWGQRIYDTLFLEVKPLLSQVPAGWLRVQDSFMVESVGDIKCSMKFQFSPPVPYPITFDTELGKVGYSYSDRLILKDHPVWGEFRAEVVAYETRVATAQLRQNEFDKMVCKICNTYSTLAPALKAWPPLWELLPEDVKDKHREIKVREKTEVVLDVDLGKLTAMSTAAKLGV